MNNFDYGTISEIPMRYLHEDREGKQSEDESMSSSGGSLHFDCRLKIICYTNQSALSSRGGPPLSRKGGLCPAVGKSYSDYALLLVVYTVYTTIINL